MKFKEWKHRLRNEKFDIPDIYERIKPYAYTRPQKSEQISLAPMKKKVYIRSALCYVVYCCAHFYNR